MPGAGCVFGDAVPVGDIAVVLFDIVLLCASAIAGVQRLKAMVAAVRLRNMGISPELAHLRRCFVFFLPMQSGRAYEMMPVKL